MELRFSIRRLTRRPGIPATIVATVGLAVAANTALFSVIDGLLFRPLPFNDPDRLLAVDYQRVGGQFPQIAYSDEFKPRREQLRDKIRNSPLVAMTSQAGFMGYFERDTAEDLGLHVHGVDSQFFPLLGLTAIAGTTFSLDDERNQATVSGDSLLPLPIVIGHDLARRLYGASSSALGVRELAGRRVRIIGVMAPQVKLPGETNVWTPISSSRAAPPTYVRLAAGATTAPLSNAFPDLSFTPLREAIRPGEDRALVFLFVAGLCLLIVAWVQVSVLTLSGSLSQFREMGVRVAIGADLRRLLRQFAMDGAIMTAAAFTVASSLVYPLTALVIRTLPEEIRKGQYLNPSLRTFAFGMLLTILGFALLTLVRLWPARRISPAALLSDRLTTQVRASGRLRQGLLAVQIGVTTLLLYVAGLATHSLIQALTFDYGFDVEHVLVFTPPATPGPRLPPGGKLTGNLAQQSFRDFDRRSQRIEASTRILEKVPGIVGVSTFTSAPLGIGSRQDLVPVVSFDNIPRAGVAARINWVGPTFVNAIGARIVAGESLDRQHGRAGIAVINEALARQLSPPVQIAGAQVDLSVIGRQIEAGPLRAQIVGVIQDLVDTRPEVPADPQVFLPTESFAASGLTLRTAGPVDSALPGIRVALERTWGPLEARHFKPMSDELKAVLVPYRGQTIMLTLISGCCLPLAAIGLVGSLMESVRSRNRETAIRLALGADPIGIRRAIVLRSLATAGVGTLAGITMGAAVASLATRQLFLVRPLDAATISIVAAALLLLAWLAALLPARIASSANPAMLLRSD